MAKGVKTGGRQKGSKNKVTVEREAQIASSGLTPLEFMLQNLRDKTKEDSVRMYAAVHAAPYCHPKLVTRSSRAKTTTKDIAGEWTMVRLIRAD